jgi:hypothetical protein
MRLIFAANPKIVGVTGYEPHTAVVRLPHTSVVSVDALRSGSR